jgi:hypothetical protein
MSMDVIWEDKKKEKVHELAAGDDRESELL